MIKKLSIIFILFSLAGALALFSKAYAQETERTFTLIPPTVQVEMAPGEKSEGTLKIINDGTTSLNFNTSIRDFIVTSDDGSPTFLPQNSLASKYSGASWLGVYPNQVYVSPGQKTEFKYYLQVPADARPGGHYAAVIYTPTNVISGGKNTGAAVNTSVATLFYITVKGPVTESASVTKFTTKKLWESAPEILTTQIKNSSDIHISPKGTITITNMLGKTSQSLDFAKSNVFPGATRGYHTTVGKGFMLGLYTAKFSATYGKSNQTLMATTSFWVIPWKIILVIIGIIVAILVGWTILKKHKGKEHNPPTSNPTPEAPSHPMA